MGCCLYLVVRTVSAAFPRYCNRNINKDSDHMGKLVYDAMGWIELKLFAPPWYWGRELGKEFL